MKKIVLILSLFLLVGCSSSSSIKEPITLYEYKGKTLSQEDVFQNLMKVDKGTTIIQSIEDEVIEELKAEKKYDLDEQVKNEFKEFEAYAKQMGVALEQFVIYYGFNDVASFKAYVANRVFMDRYATDMIKENLDSLSKKYELRNFVLFVAEDSKQAKELASRAITSTIEELKDSFKKAKSENMVYTNEYPDLDEKALKALKTEKVYWAEGTRNVFVFNDKALSDDEKRNAILLSTNYSTEVFVATIQERTFKIHNQTLKELMKKSYPEYIK